MQAGAEPHFLAVDDVTFKRPVDVGSMLQYEAMVVYTEPELPSPRVHVQVFAHIVKPETRSSVESNAFTFSFCVDKKKSVVSHVIPERGSEALLQLSVLDDIESDDYRVGLLEVKPGEAK